MTAVKLALRKHNDGLYSSVIRWVTRSKYHHCELVVNGVSYSSSYVDRGVRSKTINYNNDRWDVIEIPGDSDQVVRWFTEHADNQYDWFGALKVGLPFLPNIGSKWFCSEACAAALGVRTSPPMVSW